MKPSYFRALSKASATAVAPAFYNKMEVLSDGETR